MPGHNSPLFGRREEDEVEHPGMVGGWIIGGMIGEILRGEKEPLLFGDDRMGG